MSEARRVLLIGGGDLAGEVEEALEAAGAQVKWLEEADDESVREALADDRPAIAIVATREDAFPLRMALLVRHLDDDCRCWSPSSTRGSRAKSRRRSLTAASPRWPTSSPHRWPDRRWTRISPRCRATASGSSG